MIKELLIFLGVCFSYLLFEIIRDWLIYKQIGHARPDNPHQKDYPVITGGTDAWAHRKIDQSNSTLKIKEQNSIPKS